MPLPQNAMEIFRLLDKSNCRECGEKTCLAFAGAVFRGQRQIGDCPKLDRETCARYASEPGSLTAAEQNLIEHLGQLKEQIARTDLHAAARRLGASFANGRLTLKVLGKHFSVDAEGRIVTDIHVNPWVAVPFFNYILHGRGRLPSGNWVSFRELENGKERYPLFQKRCEAAMKRVADLYTDLFDHMVHLFDGKAVESQFESDISVVLHPLPRVPIMVCYWLPEDSLESSLYVYFDDTAEENLDIGSLFSLGAGITQMFEKLALRHGFPEAASHR